MRFHFPGNSTQRRLQMREAVLLSFLDPVPDESESLFNLSMREWQSLLTWLDTSGLALYFLDRMADLHLSHLLPREVLARLQNNLFDNTERMYGMIDESIAIHHEFQKAHLWYATLKGFSLWPHSTPKPQLRSQLDLDFLVAENSAWEARQILERRGYHLHAVSGRSMEFKTKELPGTSLKDLYKNLPSRCVELHIEPRNNGGTSLLGRTVRHEYLGICAPVLAPSDLLLGQGLHLFKHVCSEFSRTAHLLEFRRHVLFRREDATFWRDLRLVAQENSRAALALGVAIHLTTHVMGEFAPEVLTRWTADVLPGSVRRWVALYGPRSVYSGAPGSKLYLLLQSALADEGFPARRPARRALMPLRLPPPVTRVSADDTWPTRMQRYFIQLRYISFRLRFHVFEGIRYATEARRWRRWSKAQLQNDTPPASSSPVTRISSRGMKILLWLTALLVLAPLRASGQLPLTGSPQPAQQAYSGQTGLNSNPVDASDTTANDRSGLLHSNDQSTQLSLTSDQIITILQQNPDVVLELKSQVADRLQEQGRQVDANDISDEMLYEQITSSASLRANITGFLHARGYVSDDDLENAALSSSGDAANGLFTQRALTQMDNSTTLPQQPDGFSPSRMGDTGLPPSSPRASTNRAANQPERPAREEAGGSTALPSVLRMTAPYNLRSLRDLYTQVPDQPAHLRRFGSEVFVNRDLSAARGVSARDTPLDVPIGPDYVVGSGDTLTINMWGGVTVAISRVIDRDGRILLPEAGSVQVAGLPLGQLQSMLQSVLRQQYRNAQVVVTVARLRSVRVYVVGDVQRPGGYDISSLATPLSGLYAAGGPTSVGSLRILRHYRGEQLLEEIDLYDFLLHGVRTASARFENGDTLLAPAAGPEVAVFGAVKRPAIYELKPGQTSLAALLEDAGGMTPSASLGHITIERIDANRKRETVTLKVADDQSPQADKEAIAAFRVQDGDRISVQPILPYSERAIYLEGHVARPGRQPFTDGMRLTDVLHSYRDMLPEPATHGEIVRLVPPDLHAETIAFNVPDVLIGNANVDLQPFDTIRIFGRYQVDAPRATVLGEVLHPGGYPLSNGMTAAQLVRMAGGFKRDALLDKADLTSYTITNGNQVVESLATLDIGAAVDGVDRQADLPLKAGDVLTIHQITGWNDIGESITIDGQVRFPGSYGFHDGERLSSVLRRAGGFLPGAYPMGAVLIREQVRELEQKSREELVRQIEVNSAAARLSPNLDPGGAQGTLQIIKAQQDEVLADLKNHPPSGRLVIHITGDIDSWANTTADIELRRGDVLTLPKRPGFVLVTGQVYNATALTYAPGRTAGWYLSHAGGTNSTANRKEVFVIRANGSVVGRHSGEWFDPNVLSTRLNPGDVVVVPQKIIGASLLWRNLLTTAQLASSIAITAAVANI